MAKPAYVAVDWGTSSFRLWLTGHDGAVLAERRSDEGMTVAATAGFASILARHCQAVSAPAGLPVIVCGMAGARQGWVEAGYLDVPAALGAIPSAAVRVPDPLADIRILPGLAQRHPARPDVMRGEETQLLGALAERPEGHRLVCMPGTHSKWVHVAGDSVTRFSTFMTGELFEAVANHTILRHSIAEAGAVDGDSTAFRQAVADIIRDPALASNLLFGARSGALLHGLSPADAKAHISGTLIGLEVAGALEAAEPGTPVTLVAAGSLGSLYESAFEIAGIEPVVIDADAAVRAGLAVAARALWAI
ncbi:2-dehydro-3-deoxygalactonokinase [Mycoplana dimorpha]|uniref:2-keto-3-deoxygalactonate kinase n=1 Tax=Mycoplana dimorpha TaxID=28320 RepID=A0A2T5BHH6_MYCDI|nr:2-dehydro-3-deoxygalactonokinase [Mycoplana dimorpha]PTM98406.1 2-keto-3-deoxygalactonate kinase [Mycoplana dimorpha]